MAVSPKIDSERARPDLKQAATVTPFSWQDVADTDEERFLAIVKDDDHRRSDGFYVWVRGAASLAPFQALCAEEHVSTGSDRLPRVLSARYRIQSREALSSTLHAAFFADLRARSGRETSMLGVFSPEPSHDVWQRIFQHTMWSSMLGSWPTEPASTLRPELLADFWRLFNDESVLPPQHRLVLFCEVEVPEDPLSEGEDRASIAPPDAPYPQIGFVFAGVPDEDLPTEQDEHVLIVDPLPAEHALAYTHGALHSDAPAERDRLKVEHYAEALAQFVLHEQTQPPLTIGIHGPWGKGKSSFMKLTERALVGYAPVNRTRREELAEIEQELQAVRTKAEEAAARVRQLQAAPRLAEEQQPQLDDARETQNTLDDKVETFKQARADQWKQMERQAEREVVTVFFNAWQYQDAEQTWAGLAHAVSRCLENALTWHERLRMRLAYAWKQHRTTLLLNAGLFLLTIAVFVFLLVSGNDIANQLENLSTGADPLLTLLLEPLLRYVVPAGFSIAAAFYLIRRAWTIAQLVSDRVASYTQRPDYREHMGYQHLVLEDVRFLYDFLQRRRPKCKVVVYIDDLDRCSEDKVMEVLQATNLILAGCDFFVFLGMDTEMIDRAIQSYYQQHYDDAPLPPSFSRNYLRKIVQLSFYLPPIEKETRFAFVQQLFSESARGEYRLLHEHKSPEQETPESDASSDDPGYYNLDWVEPPSDGTASRSERLEVEDTGAEIDAFHTYRQFLEDNPRETLRLVNVHRLAKILLQQEVVAWDEARQRAFVRWLVFCMRWRTLVDDVLAFVTEQLARDGSSDRPAQEDVLIRFAEQLDAWPDVKAFASYHQEETVAGSPEGYVLTAEDVLHFQKATRLTQMVVDEPEHPSPTALAEPYPEEP